MAAVATPPVIVPPVHDAGRPTRRHIGGALGWKIAGQATTQGSRLVVALILARLLDPSAYGIVAMALVFTSLFTVFGDFGLGAALIQRPVLTEVQRSTAFWMSVLSAVVLFAVALVIAPAVAAFYGEPQVAPVLAALALCFVLTALSATQKALLTREMNFRALELRQIAATLVAAVVAIGLALAGAGVWAIVAQSVVFALVAAVLIWAQSPWRPSLRFSRSALRDLGGFGLDVTGTQLLFFLNRNVDNLLVGRVLGSAALGVYNIAYQLMMLPLNQVAGIVADVLLPAFARLQHDLDALRGTWMRAVRLTAVVVAPLMVGLAATAGVAVPLVLGDQWAGAVPVVQVLAWVGLHQSLQRYNSGVLQAVDRTRPLLRFSVVSCALSVVAFVAGLPWGVVGVAVAYLIATLLVAPVYLWITARAVALPLRAFAAAVAGPLAAALLMGVAVVAAQRATEQATSSGLLVLLVAVLTGASAYSAFLPLTTRGVAGEIRDLLGGLRERDRR